MSISQDVSNAIRTGVLVIAGSVLASVVMVAIWIQALPEITPIDVLIMAAIMPMLIAPVFCYFVLKDHIRAARLARENYRLAHMDELTGLPNRRAFFEAARQIQARAGFVGHHFYCAIADVDNFKRVNDQLGHEAGDQVLREIAATLNAKAPVDSIVARLGGEEFSMAGMFPSEADAARAFRALVAVVDRSPILTPDGPLPVTISLGYCEGSRTTELSSILSQADRALYAAKRGGKNRALDFNHPSRQTGSFARSAGTAA